MHRKLTGNVASDHRFRLPETQKPLSTDYVCRKPQTSLYQFRSPKTTKHLRSWFRQHHSASHRTNSSSNLCFSPSHQTQLTRFQNHIKNEEQDERIENAYERERATDFREILTIETDSELLFAPQIHWDLTNSSRLLFKLGNFFLNH